jgi:predicted ATP-dependent serine protease
MEGSSADLFGRDREQQQLDDLLGQVHARGSALLIRGEAGIGKSALMAYARRRALAKGFNVLSAAGVQSETQLAFAGLHQLLRPVIKDIALLPVLIAAVGTARRSTNRAT